MIRPSPDCLERLFSRLGNLVFELIIEIALDGFGRTVGVTDIDLGCRELANIEGKMVAVRQSY